MYPSCSVILTLFTARPSDPDRPCILTRVLGDLCIATRIEHTLDRLVVLEMAFGLLMRLGDCCVTHDSLSKKVCIKTVTIGFLPQPANDCGSFILMV